MMNKRCIAILLTLLYSSICYAQTDQPALTADGRQVVLKPDKTWVYLDEQLPSSSAQSPSIVGDDVSELRKMVDSIRSELAQTDSETPSEYSARLKQILSNRRLAKTDHSVYRSVIVIDNPDLAYEPLRMCYNLFPIDLHVTGSNGQNSGDVVLAQLQGDKWVKRNDFAAIRFPMSADIAATTKPYIRFAVYGFPVQVSEGKLFFVPTRYVVFNAKSGKRYVDMVEGNLVMAR